MVVGSSPLAVRFLLHGVVTGVPVGGSEPAETLAVTFHVPLSPPCHPAARVAGSVSRVWCPVCGREFQADDPELTPIGDLAEVGGAMSTGNRRHLLAELAAQLRPSGLLGRLSGGSVPVLYVEDPRYPPTRRVVTLHEDNGEWSYYWCMVSEPTRIAPVTQLADAARIVVYAMSRVAGIGPIDSDGLFAGPDASAEGPAADRFHHEGGGPP